MKRNTTRTLQDDKPYVPHRLDGWRKFHTVTRNLSVESFFSWMRYNALDFNAPYQREYVWGEKEQREFLTTLMRGFPVGVIALAEDTHSDYQESQWIEIVDGKQRLTTLKMVFENEIPLPTANGGHVYWDAMERREQLRFCSYPIGGISLDNTTLKERLEFFYRVNFTGVPQSAEHMNKIIELLGDV